MLQLTYTAYSVFQPAVAAMATQLGSAPFVAYFEPGDGNCQVIAMWSQVVMTVDQIGIPPSLLTDFPSAVTCDLGIAMI
jgi:hypothetical protein